MAIALVRDGGDDDRHGSSGGRHRWTSMMAIRQGRWRWSVAVLVVVDDGRVFSRGKKVARWKERILGKAANSPRLGVDNIYARFFQPFVSSFFSRSLRHTAIRRNPDSLLLIFACSTVEISRRPLLFPPSSTIVNLVIASSNAEKIEKLLGDRME